MNKIDEVVLCPEPFVIDLKADFGFDFFMFLVSVEEGFYKKVQQLRGY